MSWENRETRQPAETSPRAFCPVSELKNGDIVIANGEASTVDSIGGRADTGFWITLTNGQRITVDDLSEVVEVSR